MRFAKIGGFGLINLIDRLPILWMFYLLYCPLFSRGNLLLWISFIYVNNSYVIFYSISFSHNIFCFIL